MDSLFGLSAITLLSRGGHLDMLYDVEPAPRRPHDIISPPGGRHDHSLLRPRPKARAKWLAGSVEHNPADMIAAAFSEAEARDPLTLGAREATSPRPAVGPRPNRLALDGHNGAERHRQRVGEASGGVGDLRDGRSWVVGGPGLRIHEIHALVRCNGRGHTFAQLPHR